jgi:hypothetical protein
MGRSYTPAYAIEMMTDNGHWTPQGWDVKVAGKPTAANLAAHVAKLEASTQPGGCNAHLDPTRILAARILRNRGQRDLVAGYVAERTATLIAWVVRSVPNDPEGITVYCRGEQR